MGSRENACPIIADHPFDSSNRDQPHAEQRTLEARHPRRCPLRQSRDVLRDGLQGRRLRQADDRRCQRAFDDHAVQRGSAAAGGCGDSRDQEVRSERAGVRHADRIGRDQHGHRRHEVLAGVARSHRRFDRNLRARPMDGRRARDRRLRQEHAGRLDGDRALQCPCDLRLWRHREARSLQRQGPDDRVVVRSGRRIHRRPTERKRLQRDRAPLRARLGLVWRHVHRQYDELVVRSARHQPAVLVDDGQSGRRESEEHRRERARAGRRDQESIVAAPDHHAQVDRKRGVADHGSRRLDQRSAALPRDSALGRCRMDAGGLRASAPQSTGARRSETFGPLCRDRPAQGRRHSASAEDIAGEWFAARRLHHDHRQDDGRDAGRCAGRAAQRSGRHPPIFKSDVRARASGGAERQPRSRKGVSQKSPG